MTLFLSLLLLLATTSLQAQPWVQQLHDPSANFYDIQAAAEAYFENIPLNQRKGTGWKQYKRWEYYTEQRIDINGNRRQPGTVLREKQRFYNQGIPRSYSSDQGNWQQLGPIVQPYNGAGQPNGNGRLNGIAFHPTDADIIYVGAPSGGVWKTENGGQNWRLLDNGLTRLGISSIVIHPTDPNIIYIGTGDRDGADAPGLGVWWSTNGGETWAPRENGMGPRTVYEILMHPNNPDELLASTNDRIYRSIDGGASWFPEFNGHNCKDLERHPTNPDILYASGTRLFRSTDGGQSWSNVSNGLPSAGNRWALATTPAASDYVYVLAGGNDGLVGIYRSTDAGLSFQTQTTGPNILGYAVDGSDTRSQSWYDLVLKADPYNPDVLYAGGINIWKSTNGGVNWTCVAHWVGSGNAAAVHADQHAFEFNPLNNRWYFGHDGGLHYSDDGGINYTEITSGLAIAQVYRLGVSKTGPPVLINGYQDNGTAVFRNGTWNTEIGGDGMECIVDPTDSEVLYGSIYYGSIRRSTNGGGNFSRIAGDEVNGIDERGAWVTPYALHSQNANTMYAGYKNIWRCTEVRSGDSDNMVWEKISSFIDTTVSATCRDLEVAPSDGNVVYVSHNNSATRFMRSGNAASANPTWDNLTLQLPTNQRIWDIAVHPTNPDILWIAMQNNRVYRSADGGQSWTDLTGNLPILNVNDLIIDPLRPNLEAVYVAQDAGVFYRDSSMNSWYPFSNGMPAVEITELDIRADESTCAAQLFASTYGRGTWVSDLRDPGFLPPKACISSTQQEACLNQPVLLQSQSSYSPSSYQWLITPSDYRILRGSDTSAQLELQFQSAGSYNVQLIVSNAYGTDSLLLNNYIQIRNSQLPVNFAEDFEVSANCPTAFNCGESSCPLNSNWRNVNNYEEDDIDWRVHEGQTPSDDTGPNVDFSEGTVVGHYAYLEASNSCSDVEAVLESACIFLDDYYEFVFAAHLFGESMGRLSLDLYDGEQWLENIAELSGNRGQNWLEQRVDLSAFAGKEIRLRLRGRTGHGFASDMAIDGLRFEPLSVVATSSSPLQSRCEAGHIILHWQLDNNNPNDRISLQRSANGQDWETLWTAAVDTQQFYRFVDSLPLVQELNYYRLKINQASLDSTYSAVVEVRCNYPDSDIRAFPTPFSGQLTLQFTRQQNEELPLQIFDALGQQVYTDILPATIGYNEHILQLEQLSAGVYFLRINKQVLRLLHIP